MAVLSIGQVWGAVVSGTTYNLNGSFPDNWTGSNTWSSGNTPYFLMTASSSYVSTNEFCQKSITSIKLKARTYSSPSNDQKVITIEFVSGNSSTVLGTISPSNSTLTDYTLSSFTNTPTTNTSGYIKISCKGASNSKGSGVSQVTITYTSGSCGGDSGDGVKDVLSATDFVATSTQYKDFSGVTKTSDATYAGNSAKDNSGNIQLRSNNSNSGIVSTTSGGTVKSVKITVGSGTNTVNVYGKNTAYSAATDLYNSNTQGTLIGSTSSTTTLSISGSYAYIGIRSNSGSVYLSSVEITWEEAEEPECASPASALTITNDNTVTLGNTLTLTSNGGNGGNVTWSVVAGTGTASVSGNTLTPLTKGTVTVTATQGENTVSNVTYCGAAPTQVITISKPAPTPIVGGKVDQITIATTGVESGSYTAFSGKSATNEGHSPAVYAGKIIRGGSVGNYNIQMNTIGTGGSAGREIVSTTSGGILKRVEVTWVSTTANRSVKVYGSNTAYTGSETAVDDNELLGEIAYESGVTSDYVDIAGEHKYVQLVAVGGALNLSQINITWLPVSSVVTITSPTNGTISVKKKSDDSNVSSGTSITAGTVLKVSIGDVTGYRFTNLRAYKTGDQSTTVTISNGELTMPDYPITITATETALFAVDLAVAAQDENGDPQQGAQGNSATIDAGTVTVYKASSETAALVANKASDYDFVGWSASTGSITFTNSTATSTTATIGAAGTITATFKKKGCEKLGTPVVNVTNKTYSGAKLTWSGISNADKYKVYIYNSDKTVEIEHNDAVTETEYTIGETLTGLTTYTYTVQALSNTPASFCESNVTEATFTTNDYPSVTVTYSENGNTDNQVSKKIHTPFALPTSAAECSKTFVGWTTQDDFEDGDESEDSYYAKGANFTITSNAAITLYAVYADGGATEEKASVTIADYAAANGWDNETQHSSVSLDENVTATASSGTNTGKYYTNGNEWRFYQNESATITIATTVGELSSVKFTYGVKNTGILEDADDNVVESTTAVPASGTSAVYHVANSSTATNGQVKFTDIEVKYLKPGTLSNYSITCAAAPMAEADATDVAALVNVDAAGTNGTVAMTYTNVNLEGVVVALYNDEACTQDFDGDWLSASVEGNDKHIAYTIEENTTYVAREAYIKLTAPETTGATAPAVVVIPVEQEAKALVFSSLEDLVAAELASGTEVTVSFSNVMITEVYETNAGYRYGLYLNVKDKDGENDIELFYNKRGETEQVPDTWVKNGYVSATNLVTTWTEYKGQWELAMQGANWSWENGDITYAAPKAVSSVVVSGKPDKKAYVDGEKFNPAGLTVTVNYTIGEPDVIDAADADWVYETSDVMELNQTSINVKATYNTVTSENFYEVTDLTVNPISNKTIAQFIADEGGRCYLEGIVSGNINTTYGNFDLQDETGTIYVYGSDVFEDHGVALGDKVKVIAEEYLLFKKTGNPDKDEALNVVFVSKVSAATIDIDDIDMTEGDELLLSDIVATITPDAAQSATINYEVAEGTAVTISEGKIIASTEGEATITASIAAGEGYLAGSTTFTVTVSPAPVPFVGDYFVKVDDNSDLTAGEYLIVYEDGSLAFNGGLDPLDAISNYVAVTFENDKIQGTEAVLAATFTIKLAGTIQSKSGYYIGRLGNSNGLNSSTEEAYTNTISIDENGDAVILASGGAYLRYNSASGQERFRYFKSDSYTGQKAIQLYKKENAEPVYETVRTELEPNAYYTMCLDKAVTAVRGGSIWRVLSKAQNGSDIILEEVEGTLDAGRPYIFYATAEKLEVVYNGAAVDDPITEGNNGLIGSFQKASITRDASNYIIYNNELYYVNSGNVYVGEHRAYLNMGDVPAYGSEPQQQQGAPRRRVTMAVHGSQVATGIDALNASDAPAKVLINGQLFIIRGEKMFDAKGQLVK